MNALKVYRRINLLAFERRNLKLGKPNISQTAPSASLVLEGYNTTFFFEWPGLSEAQRKEMKSTTREAGKKAYATCKTGFTELYKWLKDIGQ